MAAAQVCPVIGTTTTVLPPQHPEFDHSKPGQVCPVTKATTDHHKSIDKHPNVPIPSDTQNAATACPAIQKEVKQDDAKELKENVCPVVGAATTVLPPDHPNMANAKEGDVCPKTNAKVEHHKGKMIQHPSTGSNADIKQCPVAGAAA